MAGGASSMSSANMANQSWTFVTRIPWDQKDLGLCRESVTSKPSASKNAFHAERISRRRPDRRPATPSNQWDAGEEQRRIDRFADKIVHTRFRNCAPVPRQRHWRSARQWEPASHPGRRRITRAASRPSMTGI